MPRTSGPAALKATTRVVALPYARPGKAKALAPAAAETDASEPKPRRSRVAAGVGRDGKVGKGRVFLEVDRIDASTVVFPRDVLSRSRFKGPDGHKVTPHQWKVYDFLLSVPVGKITTYGTIAKSLGSSAQAVGGALRDNPFAPFVPCHRVIASNLFIGGFQGEWADVNGATTSDGVKLGRKLALLAKEGVEFDERGCVVGGKELLWTGEMV